MKQIDRRALLYDFYGELLTDHQKEIYECVVYEDLSLSEIAANAGISRQGVHDMLKRCDKTLEDYEDRLHLIERFGKVQNSIAEIRRIAAQGSAIKPDPDCERIVSLTDEVMELL